MTKSWVLNVPLIANGAGGNESTFHQGKPHKSLFTLYGYHRLNDAVDAAENGKVYIEHVLIL